MDKVGIIMGSDSDLYVMQKSADILEKFGIDYEITIVSAHRTVDKMYEYGKEAKKRGIKVIIAGAGGSAHLPGMVAAITSIPVIGVPIKTKTLNGIDSLYSIVQMPEGIPVATVAINGGANAGILAAEIIGINNEEVYKKLEKYKYELKEMVEEKAKKMEDIGYKKYMEEMS